MRVVFVNFFMRLFADIELIAGQTTTSTTTTTTSTYVEEIVSIPPSSNAENSAIEKFRKFQAAQK